MVSVELRNVSKTFEDVEAVKNLSFDVKKGEFLSLLGPSGCGKTTTLRIIAGLELQDNGEIFIDGKEISNIPVHKRNIGFVFQNYALFPHMSVKENIEFGLKMKKIPKELYDSKVKNILSLVGLKGYEDRMPKQLSGGQQQRVALCRTLVLDPEVLSLDEPLSNLDAKLRKRMRIELKNIQKQIGITTIYVTHDQEEALSMSDRIVLMDRGQSVQIGTPYEIYEKPATRFVADFMGQINCYEGIITRKKDNTVTITREPFLNVTAVIPTGEEYSTKDRVFFLIRKEGINILSNEHVKKEKVNSVMVTVQVASYIGPDIEYICTFGQNIPDQITMRAPTKLEPSQLPKRGDQVRLGWETSDIFIIEKMKSAHASE